MHTHTQPIHTVSELKKYFFQFKSFATALREMGQHHQMRGKGCRKDGKKITCKLASPFILVVFVLKSKRAEQSENKKNGKRYNRETEKTTTNSSNWSRKIKFAPLLFNRAGKKR